VKRKEHFLYVRVGLSTEIKVIQQLYVIRIYYNSWKKCLGWWKWNATSLLCASSL